MTSELRNAIDTLAKFYHTEYEEEKEWALDITVNGETFKNITLIGNDECFDLDDFYQYGVDDEHIYKFYYGTCDADGEEIALDCIDYSKAERVVDITDERLSD